MKVSVDASRAVGDVRRRPPRAGRGGVCHRPGGACGRTGPGLRWLPRLPRQVPAPDEHRDRSPDFDQAPPFARNFDFRPAVGAAPFSGADEALTGGWLRLREPRTLDAATLAALCDSWYPAVFATTGLPWRSRRSTSRCTCALLSPALTTGCSGSTARGRARWLSRRGRHPVVARGGAAGPVPPARHRALGSCGLARHVGRGAVRHPAAHDVADREHSDHVPAVHHDQVAKSAAHHRLGRALQRPVRGRERELRLTGGLPPLACAGSWPAPSDFRMSRSVTIPGPG